MPDRQNFTVGTARSASLVISKYSRFENPNWLNNEIGREAFDLDVQVAGRTVVVTPRHLQLAFHGFQRSLELGKILVGLEIGIGLGERDDTTERLAEQAFRLRPA